MHAYRIVKRRRAADAFDGNGARIYGGRWNLPGTPVVYCAESRALAALEALAHFHGDERRLAFYVFEVDVTDELITEVTETELPPGWRAAEPLRETQEIGSRWQAELASVALRVPSVLVPQERCVLLNPEHPDTRRVLVSEPTAFEFDRRL